MRVGINGLGRIGRLAFRRLVNYPQLELVAVNASYSPETLAHLITYDSVHGTWDHTIQATGQQLLLDAQPVRVTGSRDPLELPWDELGVDLVIETTGAFRTKEEAGRHLRAGAERVLISAPSPDPDATIVTGINDDLLAPGQRVISAASCTTNALAPLASVLDDAFGIESGFLTTVHAMTASQSILDRPHQDLRRARSASQSIIPTTTGAAGAIGQVLPHLQGRLNGHAIRVPVPDSSYLELTMRLASEPSSAAELNQVLRQHAAGELEGILAVSDKPLVSQDYIGDPHSLTVDAELTSIGRGLSRCAGWYDNEWGYTCRLVELAARIAEF